MALSNGMAKTKIDQIKSVGTIGGGLATTNSAVNNAASNAFDLGTAYDANQKMKYRQQGINALKPPEEFKMDLASIQSDPTYMAAMESAKQATQVAEGNISSALNRRGIMDSTITANAASNAAQQEYGRVNRELLPKLIEDQYKRYVDQNNMNRQYASDLFGVSDMYANDDQTAFNNAITESSVTGNYLSPEARGLANRLVTLKNSTEAMWSTLSPEQRQAARAQGDQLRSQLQALGVDPALFGADVTGSAAQSNIGQAGIRTLGGVASDQQGKAANWGAYMDVVGQTGNLGQGPQSNWGNLINQAGTGQNTLAGDNNQFSQGVTMAQLTGYLPDGTPTSAQQQQELSNLWVVAQQTGTIPNQLADLYGLQRGTRTQDAIAQAAQISIAQQNANTSSYNASTSARSASNSASNAAFSKLMDIWQNTGVAPAGLESYGVSAGTPIASGNKSTSTNISAKDSANNLNQAKSYFQNMTASDAMSYLQNPSVSSLLTDSDYRAALKYIEDELD